MSNIKDSFKKFFSSNSLKKKGLSVNKNILTFSVFLTLSASLWFVNSLRKSFISEVVYPVAFVNPPKGMVVSGVNTSNLLVAIKADGFTLAGYYFSSKFQPLIIDISTFRGSYRLVDNRFTILTSPLGRRLTEMFSKNVQVISISPDTLYADFSSQISKRVAVRALNTLYFEKQFNQSGPVLINPDSIELTGPRSLLDSTHVIFTESQVIRNIKDSLFLRSKLVIAEPLSAKSEYCNVIVPVEPFTETKIKVSITAKNLPANLSAKFFPSEITLSYNAAISRLKSISSEQFFAEVDFSTYSSASLQPEKMRVKIQKQPLFINSVSYSPLLVDYILESKEQ